MVTSMKDKNIDFKEVLGDWALPLDNHLLKSSYMKMLLTATHNDYKNGDIRPAKADIFRAFKLTSFKDTRIVIIGQDPYPNIRASGIAFGNEYDRCGSTLSPSLDRIKDCVEKTVYDGLLLDFDPTLVSWAKQGVLLLNSALTVRDKEVGSHKARWRKFIRETISAINREKTGVIFMFWGAQANEFSMYVNKTKNFSMIYCHPAYAARQNIEWSCNHFAEANRIIELQNGKDYRIKW